MERVVVDANVLINLLLIDRADLLGDLTCFEFHVPEEVVREVRRPTESRRLERALSLGHVERHPITELAVIQDAVELRRTMGRGEAACLAIATARGWLLASDERRVFRRVASERLTETRLLDTPSIILHAIRQGLLSVEEAEGIKVELEGLRFRMRFESFQELLDSEGPEGGSP